MEYYSIADGVHAILDGVLLHCGWSTRHSGWSTREFRWSACEGGHPAQVAARDAATSAGEDASAPLGDGEDAGAPQVAAQVSLGATARA